MKEYAFQQTIDHSEAFPGTFAQRYWLDSEFAEGPAAPVLLRICGEGPGTTFMPDMTIEYAKQLHAHIIYIEHRYYGSSHPFNDTSTEHLRFLTLDNVMGDLVQFEKAMVRTSGLTGKWVSLGGSYSGTISALYRFRHPEMVVGALAASAPMLEKHFDDSDFSPDGLTSTLITEDGSRQWTYEGCTKFNFWIGFAGQIYEPSSDLCRFAFGMNASYDVDAYNRDNYAPFVDAPVPGVASASNILFTNGSRDVWNQVAIDESGNHNPLIFTKTIQGAGHHYDLNEPNANRDTPEVLAARELFLHLVQQWLWN